MDPTKPAAETPAFEDKRDGLVGFGSLLILGGVANALQGGAAIAPMVMGGGYYVFRGLMALYFFAQAGWAVWLGVGSIMTRRWARALGLISSWLWLLADLLSYAYVLPLLWQMQRNVEAIGRASQTAPDSTFVITTVVLSLSILIRVFLFIPFYSNRNTKATCESCNPQPCWTDKCPLPVLAMSLLSVLGGLIALALCLFEQVPFFGMMLSRPAACVLAAATAALSAFAARGLWKLNTKAWWLALALGLGCLASSILTFSRFDVADLVAPYINAGKHPALVKHVSAWPYIAVPAAVVGYLLYLRRYFTPTGAQATEALELFVNRLLPTSRSRILAATLSIAGVVGVYLTLSSYWTFQDRLTKCEAPYLERGKLRAAAQNHCALEVANLWAMPDYCDRMRATKNGPSVAELRARCRREVAERTNNLELCRKSGDDSETERCLHLFAMRAEDAALCTQIPDAESADACLAAVATEAMRNELCLQVQDEDERRNCITKIVERGGDMAACVSIQELAGRDACYLAASALDPGACNHITAERRTECLNLHPESLDDLDAACEGRAECLTTLASKTRNATPCVFIADAEPARRVQCFTHVFAQRSWTRESECAGLGTQPLRDACFAGLGRLGEHASACLEVVDPEMRKECVRAAGKSDASLCLALKSAADAAGCVAESSLGKTIEPRVCMLLPKPRQQGCLVQVASNLAKEVGNAR